jgi:hypothetical protein
MKAEKQRQKWKISKIGRQSPVSVLLFIICFVSMFQFFDVHPSSSLQRLDVPTHQFFQDRLPLSLVSGMYSLSLGGVSFRTVHCAAKSSFDFPASQPSLARQVELTHERLVVSMPVSSGLDVRAPPQYFLF